MDNYPLPCDNQSADILARMKSLVAGIYLAYVSIGTLESADGSREPSWCRWVGRRQSGEVCRPFRETGL